MSIKQLQGFIGQTNIAEDLDEEVLTAIGSRVKRQYDEDLASMTDWNESVKNGVDLMKQEWESKSTPWEGASNYKDPLLSQASVQFGDRATLELLRGKELIAAEVIGVDTQGEKEKSADRATTMMNYQVNHDMNDWRSGQERLFYILPNVGVVFKKMTYDPDERQAEAVLIQYPDFVVNQATTDMNSCRSFSQSMDMSANEVEYRVRTGKWLALREEPNNEKDIDKKGDAGSNEAEKVTDSIDNPEMYIEQQTFFDIDEDGYEEPYIVTMHHKSNEVVRIVARFDEQSIFVRLNDRVIPLSDALAVRQKEEIESFGGMEALNLMGLPEPEVDPDTLDLVKIVPFQQITKYGFIPAPDGTFLDLGYSHLLGALTQSLNASTNQITDRATLNNVGGGLLSKEFRKDMGAFRLRIGEWRRTNVPADKMNGILPNPTGEPSQALFTMVEKTREVGQKLLATVDISGQITAQTSPTTALAIIQEGMIPTSALFKRILNAESNEFRILFRLNQRTLDNEEYQEILDDPQANVETDFNIKSMDISPTASAEMSTKMQRIQVAQIELEQFDRVLQTGGNPVPIVKNFFDAIGSQIIDQIYPEEGSMSPAEQKQLQQLQQAQEKANQLQELQLQILEREQNRLDQDSQADREETAAKVAKLGAELEETLMNAAKLGEEAETEALNNQLTKYTANVQIALDKLLAVGAINDRNIAASPALQAPINPARTIQ